MKILRNRWILLFLFLCVSYEVLYIWDRRADGFTIEKIHSDLAYDPQWDVTPNKEATRLLKQPFHYLDRGFQCYAFESADGNYVLKFMRHQRLRSPFYYTFLPDLFFKKYKEEKTQERAERRIDLFTSLKTAYELIPEESGLLYLHLNKTSGEHPTVVIFDATDTKYEVALDGVEFVLQQKAQLIKPTLIKLMHERDMEAAKERINQIFTLLARCAKKGVRDLDGALIHKDNLGFLPDRAMYIDTGKLVYQESYKTKASFKKDLERLRPLHKWLVSKYPPLASHFEKQKRRTLQEYDSN